MLKLSKKKVHGFVMGNDLDLHKSLFYRVDYEPQFVDGASPFLGVAWTGGRKALWRATQSMEFGASSV